MCLSDEYSNSICTQKVASDSDDDSGTEESDDDMFGTGSSRPKKKAAPSSDEESDSDVEANTSKPAEPGNFASELARKIGGATAVANEYTTQGGNYVQTNNRR